VQEQLLHLGVWVNRDKAWSLNKIACETHDNTSSKTWTQAHPKHLWIALCVLSIVK
jgi:hypothetical protein